MKVEIKSFSDLINELGKVAKKIDEVNTSLRDILCDHKDTEPDKHNRLYCVSCGRYVDDRF